MSIEIIIASLYFFIPAYIANATPVLLKKADAWEELNKPIDCGKKINNNRIFGSHKTIRGALGILSVGTVMTIVFFAINNFFNLGLYEAIGIDTEYWNPLWFGALFSIGVIFGDLLFAFIKRRIRLKPGAPFIPFDQTNYVIGTFIVLQPFINLSLSVWLIIFIFTFIVHASCNMIGYKIGLHNAKW
jgi:CDP-2,3-bis-(O-geranylgeranyl)-sn-glycerol synthase